MKVSFVLLLLIVVLVSVAHGQIPRRRWRNEDASLLGGGRQFRTMGNGEERNLWLSRRFRAWGKQNNTISHGDTGSRLNFNALLRSNRTESRGWNVPGISFAGLSRNRGIGESGKQTTGSKGDIGEITTGSKGNIEGQDTGSTAGVGKQGTGRRGLWGRHGRQHWKGGQGRGFFRRGNNILPNNVVVATWTRDVGDNVTVRERVFMNRTAQTAFFVSYNERLQDGGTQMSVSAYDFNSMVAATRTQIDNSSVCIIVPGIFMDDFNTTADNVTTRSTDVTMPLASTVGEFTLTQGEQLLQENRLNSTDHFLTRFCRGRFGTPAVVIEATVVADGMTDLSDTRSITVPMMNGEVLVHVPTTFTVKTPDE